VLSTPELTQIWAAPEPNSTRAPAGLFDLTPAALITAPQQIEAP
jgi:hypothetical protein